MASLRIVFVSSVALSVTNATGHVVHQLMMGINGHLSTLCLLCASTPHFLSKNHVRHSASAATSCAQQHDNFVITERVPLLGRPDRALAADKTANGVITANGGGQAQSNHWAKYSRWTALKHHHPHNHSWLRRNHPHTRPSPRIGHTAYRLKMVQTPWVRMMQKKWRHWSVDCVSKSTFAFAPSLDSSVH